MSLTTFIRYTHNSELGLPPPKSGQNSRDIAHRGISQALSMLHDHEVMIRLHPLVQSCERIPNDNDGSNGARTRQEKHDADAGDEEDDDDDDGDAESFFSVGEAQNSASLIGRLSDTNQRDVTSRGESRPGTQPATGNVTPRSTSKSTNPGADYDLRTKQRRGTSPTTVPGVGNPSSTSRSVSRNADVSDNLGAVVPTDVAIDPLSKRDYNYHGRTKSVDGIPPSSRDGGDNVGTEPASINRVTSNSSVGNGTDSGVLARGSADVGLVVGGSTGNGYGGNRKKSKSTKNRKIDVEELAREFNVDLSSSQQREFVQWEIVDKLNLAFGYTRNVVYRSAMRNTVEGMECLTDAGSGVTLYAKWSVRESDSPGGFLTLTETNYIHCNILLSVYIKSTLSSSHKQLHDAFGRRFIEQMER